MDNPNKIAWQKQKQMQKMCVYSTNFLISLHMFNWNYCLVNMLFGGVCACSFLLYFFRCCCCCCCSIFSVLIAFHYACAYNLVASVQCINSVYSVHHVAWKCIWMNHRRVTIITFALAGHAFHKIFSHSK